MRQNAVDYWELSTSVHTANGLPKTSSQDLYNQIHEWYGSQPKIQPPHTHDLLATQDRKFASLPSQGAFANDGSAQSQPDTKDLSAANLSDSGHQAASIPISYVPPSFQVDIN